MKSCSSQQGPHSLFIHRLRVGKLALFHLQTMQEIQKRFLLLHNTAEIVECILISSSKKGARLQRVGEKHSHYYGYGFDTHSVHETQEAADAAKFEVLKNILENDGRKVWASLLRLKLALNEFETCFGKKDIHAYASILFDARKQNREHQAQVTLLKNAIAEAIANEHTQI